jgi:hypothetical protein
VARRWAILDCRSAPRRAYPRVGMKGWAPLGARTKGCGGFWLHRQQPPMPATSLGTILSEEREASTVYLSAIHLTVRNFVDTAEAIASNFMELPFHSCFCTEYPIHEFALRANDENETAGEIDERFVMAFPKPAFSVVDGLASGPGPPGLSIHIYLHSYALLASAPCRRSRVSHLEWQPSARRR